MPEKGNLNGSQDGGEKGYFGTPKMEFPSFPDFGICRWRGGSQVKRGIGRQASENVMPDCSPSPPPNVSRERIRANLFAMRIKPPT